MDIGCMRKSTISYYVTGAICLLQLHQLGGEVLQHAQQKAERFGRGGHKSFRAAHRSEGDPFADAAPSGQYDELPSGSEDEAGDVCFPADFVTMSPNVAILDVSLRFRVACTYYTSCCYGSFVVCSNTQYQHTLEVLIGKPTAASLL